MYSDEKVVDVAFSYICKEIAGALKLECTLK